MFDQTQSREVWIRYPNDILSSIRIQVIELNLTNNSVGMNEFMNFQIYFINLMEFGNYAFNYAFSVSFYVFVFLRPF